MPPSALDCLLYLEVDYPMMFSVQNPRHDGFYADNGSVGGQITHCGESEFTADEGFVHMPRWIMNQMELQEGDIVFFKDVILPKGTDIKLQPHSADFVRLPDQKAFGGYSQGILVENKVGKIEKKVKAEEGDVARAGKKAIVKKLKAEEGGNEIEDKVCLIQGFRKAIGRVAKVQVHGFMHGGFM
ncbi:OLC1v1012142C1 [Oldenlandia corymbosa var. corymbosa]|uniref:OLC1v1012142C1 n=1 Tax=Oldenlandia corymbosa var. corymbosa TaxID=529605 RepID=A0AAV1DVA2_OLDCO|nr:OLC1v1012142C1 [Oldenlandia corymbosa var. corymbosa]